MTDTFCGEFECIECRRWQNWWLTAAALGLDGDETPSCWRLRFDDGTDLLEGHGMGAWETYVDRCGQPDEDELEEDFHSPRWRWPGCSVEIYGLELN